MGNEGRTILIVGGAGYIGSHMVKLLLNLDYNVLVLDNFSTGNEKLLLGGSLFRGDLSNVDLLDHIFSENSVDAVMHFAAFSLVGESVTDPMKYYRNNVAETAVLIQSMLDHGVRHFIFSSSAAVYGEPQYTPIDEAHPCNPTNPYGATKIAVERMLFDCSRAYDFTYASLRYFNAAGADASGSIGEMHDPESHLIPLLLKVARAERSEIHIYGDDYNTPDGTCIRDYVHVNDLASAHLLALEGLISNRISSVTYNLGNSVGYSVFDVLQMARRVTGKPIPHAVKARRSGDPAVLIADSKKIRDELGWTPAYEKLDAIIESAWLWHQKQ